MLFTVLSEGAFANERQLGILVRVKNKEALKSKDFKDLITKNNLFEDRY